MNWKDKFPKESRYFETENGILYCADAVQLLKEFFDESVDLVITDPPYNSFRMEWDKKDDEWQFLWLEQVKRIMKEGASFYCFFAPLNMYGVEGWIRKNLNLKNVCVWYHPNLYGAGMSYGKDRWKSTWDVIFYAVKGEKAGHGKNVSQYAWMQWGRGFDVFQIADERPKLHRAQKPLKLIMKLVDVSSGEEEIVLDPFLGSGTTAVACEKLNRKWVGIEIDERYCEIVKERVLGEVKKGKLFRHYDQVS